MVITLLAGFAVSSTENSTAQLTAVEARITDKILGRAVAAYEVDGNTFTVTLATDLEPGDRITVYYNPKHPSFANAGANGNDIGFFKSLHEKGQSLLPYYWCAAGFALLGLLLPRAKGAADRHKRNAAASEIKGIQENPVYWERFYNSMHCKQQGMLVSALAYRQGNLSHTEGTADSGYRGLAAHDIMILELFQCADGKNAYLHGKASLEDPAFANLANTLEKQLHYNTYHEALMFTAMLACSYEEAEKMLMQAELCCNKKLDKEIATRRNYRKDCPRWFDFQRAMSFNYYSRTNEASDKGDYSPACALLQIILQRAEEPGYDVSYEEYLDALDDYLVLSFKYFARMVGVILQNGGGDEAAEHELLFLLTEPLKILSGFLPDCRAQDKQLLKNDLEPYRSVTPLTETDLFKTVDRVLQ